MKRVTIKDVAREAGVSIAAVSFALSGGGKLSQETRNRVIETAARMQYIPDRIGRNLKISKTGIIGLGIVSVHGYYGQLADAICEECRRNGYELEIFMAEDGDFLLQSILGQRVDGAIILHSGFTEQNEKALIDSEVPAVFLDREIEQSRVSSVLLDSYMAGRIAAEYLFSKGHRKILFVRGADNYDGNQRQKGFEDFMRNHGLWQQDYYINGFFQQYVAYSEVLKFLDKGFQVPDAIFATNDNSAFGCIAALANAGYSVPGDISVIGCDDIEMSGWYAPALTTVRTNISEQGVTAAKEILRLVRGEGKGKINKIAAQIVERATCKVREF